MVSAFLRQAAEGLDGMSPSERADALSRIRRRIKEELEQLGAGTHEDELVARALRRCQKDVGPSTNSTGAEHPRATPQKARKAEQRSTPERSERSATRSEARWLGVCDALARLANMPPGVVRACFVVFGLFTWPIALVVYIAAYFALVLSKNRHVPQHWNPVSVLGAAGRAAAWVSGLYALCWGVQWLGLRVYAAFMNTPLDLNAWTWLATNQHRLFAAAFLASIPMAVLSALPIANEWDRTLRKLSDAVIALYALILLIGLICLAAGATLQAAMSFTT